MFYVPDRALRKRTGLPLEHPVGKDLSVDITNPIARGLGAAFLLGRQRQAVTLQPFRSEKLLGVGGNATYPFPHHTYSQTTVAIGAGWREVSSTSGIVYRHMRGDGFAVMVIFGHRTSTSNDDRMVFWGRSGVSSGTRHYLICNGSADEYRAAHGDTYAPVTLSGPAPSDLKETVLIYNCDYSGNVDAWNGGVKTFIKAREGFKVAHMAIGLLGGSTSNTSYYAGGKYYTLYIWRRALNDRECESISRDPYQFIVPSH